MARKKKRGRPINGILLFDKPIGLSSNQALQQVKKLYGAQKAGHTGSLDPLATGMLPICFGEATKVTGYLLDADKYYRIRAQLGVTTSTGDAEGDVLETCPLPALDQASLEKVLQSFVGRIEQIPPMYSALKHEGKRLYELARQGVEVERKPRQITIHDIKFLDLDNDSFEMDVHCSKGTYVRTLVEDIGQQLGCGAHVTALRRLQVGPFRDASQMVTMQQLELAAAEDRQSLDNRLLPMDAGLMDWPEVQLNRDLAYYLKQGQPVQVPGSPSSGWLRVYSTEPRQLIAVGQIIDDGRVAPRRQFLT